MTIIEIKNDLEQRECCSSCPFRIREHGFDEKEWHDYYIDKCSVTKENIGHYFKKSPDGPISPNCPITKWKIKS